MQPWVPINAAASAAQVGDVIEGANAIAACTLDLQFLSPVDEKAIAGEPRDRVDRDELLRE